ncbi:MAG: hypothetical protein ACM3L9_01735 [Deltaproteobacteria bacterium]
MNDVAPTPPTATVTAGEFARIVKPPRLEGLSCEDKTEALRIAEQRGLELAARLSVTPNDGRLPGYIWAIAFAQD